MEAEQGLAPVPDRGPVLVLEQVPALGQVQGQEPVPVPVPVDPLPLLDPERGLVQAPVEQTRGHLPVRPPRAGTFGVSLRMFRSCLLAPQGADRPPRPAPPRQTASLL